MDGVHYFAAVWSAASPRWAVLFRCASDVERARLFGAWAIRRPSGASVVLGHCDAGLGAGKLLKELRRLPSPASDFYAIAFERFTRRVSGSSSIPAFHFDVDGDGELRLRRSETVH